jgi:glycosyltransferase involved in cell wall biosynthesis
VFLLSSTLATGGSEMVFRALALKLPGYGFVPHLVCLRDPGEVGMDISRRGVIAHFNLSRGRFDPGALFRLSRLLRRDRDAIMLTLDHHDAVFLGAWASTFAGLKHRVMAVHSTGLWSKSGSLSRTDRLVLPRYERIVALAGLHAEYLQHKEGLPPERIAVINNGIDPERFRPTSSAGERLQTLQKLRLPDGRFIVTIVAALRPEKNHVMLLRAAAEVSRRRDSFLFLIVGEGKEAGKLQEIARELSLGESVRFMGRREDIPEIMSISNVSVLCSHPVVETFPLAILESMAAGVAVVSTRVGSIPEMIEEGVEGFLIPPGNTKALAQSLERLEADPQLAQEMGSRGRAKVLERFSEDHMVKGYAELFREMLGEGGNG